MAEILVVHEIVNSPAEFPELVTVKLLGELDGVKSPLFAATTSRDLQVCRRLSKVNLLAYVAERWGILDMVAKECQRRHTTQEMRNG